MSAHWRLSLALSAALACGAASAAPPEKPAPVTASAIEPSAIQAIEQMSAKLRSLGTFTVNADVLQEYVLANGQKVALTQQVLYKVKTPEHLYAELDSDRSQRRFYYDGKQFTIYAPRVHFYAQKPVTGKLASLVDEAGEKYNINLPLADLFFWGTDRAPMSAIKTATVVGPEHVGKIECDHLLMHQEGVDWQVWIARDTLLPAKLIITTLDETSQPSYFADLTWDTSPTLPDTAFTFKPGPDDHPIALGAGASATKESAP